MYDQRESTENNNPPRNPSKSPMAHKDQAFLRDFPSPDPHDFPAGSLKDPTPSPYSAQGGHSTEILKPFFRPRSSYSAQGEQSREARRAFFLESAGNRAFLTFLSSYGPGGVSLRELVMLATLRQSGRESVTHWPWSGELGTLEAAIMFVLPFEEQDWVFGCFKIDGVVDHNAIESFQELLEDSNYIDVRYPKGSPSDKASQYWHLDERIWIIRGSEFSEPSAPIDDVQVLCGLVDFLIGIPDKDVSASAQRQREVYYYHAHFLIRRVIRSRELLKKHPPLHMQAVFVTLQLLTHRYQSGDSLLLDFVRNYFSVRSLYSDMNVMLLWAELKETTFREDYGGLCTIRDRVLNLVDSKDVQSGATPQKNGFLGFVIVDLMKSAKALHFEDLVADTLKAGTKWVDSAQRNSTSIENTALCEMLATFDIHARNEIIQKEYHLFYGYHLSRAGFLEQGDHFLACGLKGRGSLPLWSYEMERVSIALRLGRQNEATRMLKSLRELALRYRDTGHFEDLMEPLHGSVPLKHPGKRGEEWKRSGECAEVFVLLNLYEADCSVSAGRLDDACAKLKSGIGITSSVYDAYIRILRITLQMRLLEILMWQGSLQEALPVATNLASEILDERTNSTLASDVVYGIAQQLLTLSNALLSAGKAAASMALLKSITSIRDLVPGELFKEFTSHVDQRMIKERHFSQIETDSGDGPTLPNTKSDNSTDGGILRP